MDTTPSKANQRQRVCLEKLQQQYPYLEVSKGDTEKFPSLCSLLTSLGSHLNADGLSKQTDKDLKQASEMLRREKHSWLLNYILHLEIEELLLDYELKSLDTSLSSRDQQFYRLLQHSLTQAEIADYLDFSPDPSNKVTTLGLTQDELDKQNNMKKHLAALQQALIPEIEERLRKRCENLVLAYQPHKTQADSSKLMFAKSSQLPALVETDLHHLEEGRQLLKQEITHSNRQFSLYYQKLLESLRVLEELIRQYKLKHQQEHDTITAEWLYAKCDAMSLKIKLVELQVLCETYTIETVEALKKVRGELDRAWKESEREKLHRAQALTAYQAVDGRFNDIVSQYGKLLQDLEYRQWAIGEFEKGKNTAVND